MTVSRRDMLAGAAVLPAALSLGGAATAQTTAPARFSLAYAPHQGTFASRGGMLDQIGYAADQGFTAWEDNEASTRPVAEQEAMARALRARGMRMGVFVAGLPRWSERRPLLGTGDGAAIDAYLSEIRASLDVARRTDARWATIVPGFVDDRRPIEMQTAGLVDVLRRAADIVEPHGLTLVMEPLNTLTDHPGVLLRTVGQAYAIARAVDRPSIKILADLYHEQIQAGNLIPTLDACWSEIAYLQFGDNPGRKEPGTGEINYRTVVGWLRARGFDGVIGMEHGNGQEGPAGEARLVAAYREIDRV